MNRKNKTKMGLEHFSLHLIQIRNIRGSFQFVLKNWN